MDGLEDQAEAAMEGLLQQLYTQDRVEIKHSSRDTVMLRVTEEIKNHSPRHVRSHDEDHKSDNDDDHEVVVVKSLIFRSGVSLAGLHMLRDALRVNDTINSLEFVCLGSIVDLKMAMECCQQQANIQKLVLKSYSPSRSLRRVGHGPEAIATTIRDCVFGVPACSYYDDGPSNSSSFQQEDGIPTLHTLEIVNVPIGTDGAQILADAVAKNTTLTTLKLVDCDLRSDSATAIAQMIKGNKTLLELDLSFNRHYLGSEITRELTLKTLVRRGLRFNVTLLDLKMEQTQRRGRPIKHSHVEQQLDISKFRKAFVEAKCDPFSVPPAMWSRVLARAAAKPSALFLFLQDGIVALFR